jgi:TfoX/Sxy family transcriptional regulator of competence genes
MDKKKDKMRMFRLYANQMKFWQINLEIRSWIRGLQKPQGQQQHQAQQEQPIRSERSKL